MGALYSKYSRVFDLLPELIFVLDRKGTILDYNASVSRELLEDGKGKSLHSIFDLLKGGHKEKFSSILQTVDVDVRFRSQFSHSDNRVIDVELILKKFDSGSLDVLVLIAHDMTEQEKMELDLLRFSEVMQHTMSPIQITDAQGKRIAGKKSKYPQQPHTGRKILGASVELHFKRKGMGRSNSKPEKER
jgi:PAS domain S-box-containing protein